MITIKNLLLILLMFPARLVFGQSNVSELKVGHVFYIDIPEYMSKTVGINNAASVQFKSVTKDIYGFIIEDSKEELNLTDMKFASINEFYDYFVKDFLKDEDKRNISPIHTFKKDEKNYVEMDASYYDKDAKADIYYYVCIVETKNYYYKILCYSALENKDKFKSDFQKIPLSLKE